MSIEMLEQAIDDGLVIRRKWTDVDEAGRHRACLLATIAPECGEKGNWMACPANVMPPWLAALTPWIDDSGSEVGWPGQIRRYAAVARRWHVLTPDEWQRCLYRVLIATVEEAKRHTTHDRVISVCDQSIAAILGLVVGEKAAEAAEAADRIISAILGILEDACTAAEARS